MYLETEAKQFYLLCGCFPIVVKSTMAGKIMGINRFLDTAPHPHRSTSCVVIPAPLCLQAHVWQIFGHTKFQLSIFCTFEVMKFLVEVKVEQKLD